MAEPFLEKLTKAYKQVRIGDPLTKGTLMGPGEIRAHNCRIAVAEPTNPRTQSTRLQLLRITCSASKTHRLKAVVF